MTTQVQMIDTAVLKRSIMGVGRTAKNMQEKIHMLAVQCMLQAQTNGNYEFAGQLVSSLPKSVRVKALQAWFRNHAPIKFRKDKQGLTVSRKDKSGSAAAFNLEAAIATPFYTPEEREPVPFTSKQAKEILARLLGRVQKRRSLADTGELDAEEAKELAAIAVALESTASQIGLIN